MSDSTTDLTRRYLRPEAETRDRFDLDKAQQHALKRIAESLSEALHLLSAESGDVARLDRGLRRPKHSANRMCFLSGVRGTGKTTVLYSLLDGIESLRTGRSAERPDDPLAALRTTADRVIILEPLDMEALGEPANLLAAVLARVEQVAEYPADEWEKPGGDRGPSPYARAFDEFSRVQCDAALAWASGIADRGERVDPDTLATETRRVEFARLRLAERIDNVLGQLSHGIPRATVFPPRATEGQSRMFLLPVDDFDLNPARCLELLKLLRMLNSRRLFAVVVGSHKIAETIFGLKMWNDLADVAGANARALVQLRAQQRGTRLFSLAQSLAAEAMRKLIPPGQIVRLKEMRVSEALAYPDVMSPDRLEERFKKFALGSVSVAQGGTLATLPFTNVAELLLLQADKTHSSAARWSHGEGYIYPGAAVLHAPPRRIADAWAEIDRVLASPEGNTLSVGDFIAFLARNYQRAVREDDTFEPLERDILLDAVRRDFRGHWELQTDLIRPVHYSPQPDLKFKQVNKLNLALAGNGGAATSAATVKGCACRRWNDWDLLPNSRRATRLVEARRGNSARQPSEWPSPAPHSHMSDQLQATIMVLHDLLVLTAPGGLVGSPLVPCLDAAVAEYWFDYSLTTNSSPEPCPYRISVPWPTPRWETFWEYSLLRHAWNIAWAEAEAQAVATPIAWLAFRWLLACTAILSGKVADDDQRALLRVSIGLNPSDVEATAPEAARNARRRLAATAPIPWEVLQAALRGLTQQGDSNVRTERVQAWLRDVAVVAYLAGVLDQLSASVTPEATRPVALQVVDLSGTRKGASDTRQVEDAFRKALLDGISQARGA